MGSLPPEGNPSTTNNNYNNRNMDRKFYVAVLVIGLIALSSVAEGNPAARPRTGQDVSNAEHPFLRAAVKGDNDAKCAGSCFISLDCGPGCYCDTFGNYCY